jgi:hypothetical protein
LYGEAVVQANLGALTPRVLDVVRIFYPNQILTVLADIQPLDGVVGSIFIMKPRFSNDQPANTIGRVTAGQEIFANTSYYYASEVVGQTLGTGDNAHVTYSGTLSDATHRPLRKKTIQVTTSLTSTGVVVAVDDGAGALTGTHVSTGTIDYASGAISVTFDSNVADKTVVVATYQWNSETQGDNINEIEFDMSLVPVQAKIHPLKFKYSVPAGLAASAHLAVDVQDTLAELAGQFMKMERDNLGVKLICDNAPNYGGSSQSLYFNATPSTYYRTSSVAVPGGRRAFRP